MPFLFHSKILTFNLQTTVRFITYFQSWAFKKHIVKRKREFRNQNFSRLKRKRKFRNQNFLSLKASANSATKNF